MTTSTDLNYLLNVLRAVKTQDFEQLAKTFSNSDSTKVRRLVSKWYELFSKVIQSNLDIDDKKGFTHTDLIATRNAAAQAYVDAFETLVDEAKITNTDLVVRQFVEALMEAHNTFIDHYRSALLADMIRRKPTIGKERKGKRTLGLNLISLTPRD